MDARPITDRDTEDRVPPPDGPAAIGRDLATEHEALRTALYRLAHDLKGPCRRQSALIGILIEDHGEELSPEIVGLLERLQDQATAMSTVVDDVVGQAVGAGRP